MLPLSLNAPSMFPSFQCSPSVCADVHAAVKNRLEEGDVDGLVRSRFTGDGPSRQATVTTGSRLLRQMNEVRGLTGENDPLAAFSSLLREVRELRETRDRLLQATGQLSEDAALATVEDAMRDRTELRAAEEAFATTLNADGWRSVAAELESARHLEQRVRAFSGVQSKDAGSLEAALRILQHRERERLTLVQHRIRLLPKYASACSRATTPKWSANVFSWLSAT